MRLFCYICYILVTICYVNVSGDSLSASPDSIIPKTHIMVKHHVNFRDPKDEKNKMDWWVGGKASITFDSLHALSFYIKGSTEKDNGIRYYQHTEKVAFKYGYTQYYIDTEDSIELLNITGYYVFIDIFKVGADFAWDHWEEKYGAYFAVELDWFFAEISFFKEINRIRASLTPAIALGKKEIFSFGLDCEVNYVDKLIDWKAGYSIGVKLNI